MSLYSALRTVFYSEYAPQLTLSAFHPLPANKYSLPYHSLRNKRGFSSARFALSPQSDVPKSSDDGPATMTDSSISSTPDQHVDDQPPAESATLNNASLPSPPRTKTRPKKSKVQAHKTARDGNTHPGLKPTKKREGWQIQKEALKKKFADGWSPPKKLSPDAMEGIRHLHAVAPDRFTTPVLAEQFKVSPEAIRRILKSKWRPSETELEDRRKRWEKRHDRIWSHLSELGLRPHTKHTESVSDAAAILYDRRNSKSKG